MPTPKAPADPYDAGMVRKLADILKEKGLTEIEVERGGLKIRVAMAPAGQTTMLVPQTAAPPAAPVAVPAQAVGHAAAPAEETGETVKSPMVGTVYLQAQPGSPAFVKVGDKVEQGQTLLLIEAMKTMNPIGAPRAGRVLRLLVSDAQPVEYGEPLVVLE